MREVKFRWVDRYLIHMTLQEKQMLLFFLPLLVILAFVAIMVSQVHQAGIDGQIRAGQARVEAAAGALSQVEPAQAPTVLKAMAPELQLYDNGNQAVNGLGGDLQGRLRQLKGEDLLVDGDMAYIGHAVAGKDWYLGLSLDLSKAGGNVWEELQSWLIIMAVAVLLMAMTTYYVATFIGGALYSNVQAINRVADGDLTFRLNFFRVRDEFSILAIAIDKLAERQQNLVTLISDTANALGQSADSFRTHAGNAEGLAQAQRQHLDSLATAMEEMSAAVKEVAQNAEHASAETQLASDESNKGAQNIQETINAIETLSQEIFEASSAMAKVNDNARRIDEVVTTINAISEQTNLLALNAAIEAARAGEQGRGFAVVADEVRSLAARTQQATVEIQGMIEELQSGTNEVTQIMDKTVAQAEQGGALVAQAGQDLDTITRHSERVFSMMAQIAASAEQQSSVADEIAHNITDVRQQSLEVEHAAVENAAGTEELLETAKKLKDILQGLKI
ncbi:methyl-accepting chemotaxis protein [Gallaecimonas sp. GXIMD4217]|uniref:methyl-accepting chemotaxis protein n=1 Tax=Gallaecimonas sp. GXIMD4217 TaxID=3131927 RepID=UPI00311AC178